MGKEREDYTILHPDVPRARRRYAQGHKDAFSKELTQEREEKMRRGEEYWESSHDGAMQRRARKRTGAAIARGEFDWEEAGKKKERSLGGPRTRRTNPA